MEGTRQPPHLAALIRISTLNLFVKKLIRGKDSNACLQYFPRLKGSARNLSPEVQRTPQSLSRHILSLIWGKKRFPKKRATVRGRRARRSARCTPVSHERLSSSVEIAQSVRFPSYECSLKRFTILIWQMCLPETSLKVGADPASTFSLLGFKCTRARTDARSSTRMQSLESGCPVLEKAVPQSRTRCDSWWPLNHPTCRNRSR